MEDNPYLRLAGLLDGGTAPAGLTFGKVTSAAPLKVLVGGNTMEGGELLCNAALVTKTVKVGGELAGNGSVGDSSGTASLALEGELERKDAAWRVGEQLLMLPIEDAQRYVIICKVVEL